MTEHSDTRRQLRRFILLVLAPAAFLVISLFLYMKSGRFVETDNAYVKADVIPISAEVSGVVKEVLVSANESVAADQLLFVLDRQPYQVAVNKAAAKLAQVRAELDALQTSYREMEARIELAQSNHGFARRELERQEDLKGRNFTSASTIDDLEHKVDVSRQELRVLSLDLQQIAASLGGNAERPLEKHPAYLSALADVEEARLNLRRAEVRAPLEGVVSRAPLRGQYVHAGTMVTSLVANAAVWVEANFTETDLTHMQVGQQARVRIDTYPDITWEGKVDSISPATGAEFSIIPAQNATGNWVKIPQRVPVRIGLKMGSDAPELLVGLSAIVEVDTQHRRHLLGFSF
ncbi:MAG: HlyD family secretion protein [Cellvibrionaceae bacterium]